MSRMDGKKLPANNYISLFLIILGLVWIFAAAAGETEYQFVAILLFFTGITLFKPIFNFFRRLLLLPPMTSDNPLKMLSKLLAISIPAGLIAGFFVFIDNANAFFPVFGILYGVVFGITAYFHQDFLIGLSGVLLAIIGLYYSFFEIETFSRPGYACAVLLIAAGAISKFSFSPARRLAGGKNKP